MHETPGVTRDRTESVCEWRGREFVLIDTGGVDPGDDSPMQSEVAEQARIAVQEAHLVLLVIDARAGLAAGDEEIAQILRRSRRPVLVVANKVDDPSHEAGGAGAARAGTGRSDARCRRCTDAAPATCWTRSWRRSSGSTAPSTMRTPGTRSGVAILGRPNVGKSSLLNAILGRPRVIVSEVGRAPPATASTPSSCGTSGISG